MHVTTVCFNVPIRVPQMKNYVTKEEREIVGEGESWHQSQPRNARRRRESTSKTLDRTCLFFLQLRNSCLAPSVNWTIAQPVCSWFQHHQCWRDWTQKNCFPPIWGTPTTSLVLGVKVAMMFPEHCTPPTPTQTGSHTTTFP